MSDVATYRSLAGLAKALSERALADFAVVEAEDTALRAEISVIAAQFAGEAAALETDDDYATRRALETYRLSAEAQVLRLEAARVALRQRWEVSRGRAMRAQGRAKAVELLLDEAEQAEKIAAMKREEDERSVLVALKRAAASKTKSTGVGQGSVG